MENQCEARVPKRWLYFFTRFPQCPQEATDRVILPDGSPTSVCKEHKEVWNKARMGGIPRE